MLRDGSGVGGKRRQRDLARGPCDRATDGLSGYARTVCVYEPLLARTLGASAGG